MKSFNLLSKLFLEKIIDFVLVILTGIISFLLLGITEGKASATTIFTFSGIVLSGIILSIYVVRYQNIFLRNFLKKITNFLGKEELYLNHIDIHIEEMGEFLKIKNFIKPLGVSLIIWGCYFSTYTLAKDMLSIQINPLEIGFILFCGAMSLAVPSAPSGVGVFHASIISAFLVIGKDPNEGLVYATLLHLISFFALTSSGLLFYLFWVYKRRNSGKTLSFKS